VHLDPNRPTSVTTVFALPLPESTPTARAAERRMGAAIARGLPSGTLPAFLQ
jgi:hypothetical protein